MKITGAQDYDKLSAWWNDQGNLYGRHIYPGLALYKMTDANNWEALEIQNQINLNRDLLRTKVLGQIMFSTKQIMADNKGIKTALQQNQYRYKSYAPAMSWKDAICPNSPANVRLDGDTLRWDAPTAATDGDIATKYVVYKYDSETDLAMLMNDGTKVIDIISTTKLYIPNAGFARFVVSALDKNNNESAGTTSTLPVVVMCPNASNSLSALVTGNTYAWQWFSNGNWEPLANGPYFTATNTNTLQISNLPVSYYGMQLRCVANANQAGPAYTLTFGTVWTGGANSSWSNPSNWNCGVIPFKDLDAIIPASVTIFPLVDIAEAAARSVQLKTGATIQVPAGNHLKISKE
jgi:hypothetical protein